MTSPANVRELFQALLKNPTSATAPERLSSSTRLTSPPRKNSVRYLENDQNNRREKYDGHRWRLVCTWSSECTNLAYNYQLCPKHNYLRRNKELPGKKRKPLITHSSLPIIKPYKHNNKNYAATADDDDEEEDIQILEDYCIGPTHRHSMNSNIKAETPDFHVFSVEHIDEADICQNIKSEPRASSSYRSNTAAATTTTSSNANDIQYVSSKIRTNGLNITELLSKNLPPLTEFEEEYLTVRLMQEYPTTCSMLDAQLFIHNEAMAVVKRNYRLKMDTIAPEYFYDFLLRHPRVALHYSRWFLRTKPIPPTTGCPIDTKVWTLSMIVRGATATDNMIDE